MPSNRTGGFTLIEILVVIAIVATLAAIIFVSLTSARGQARNAQRLTEIRQFADALELYVSDSGHYPISATTTECDHPAGNWIPDGTNYNWSNAYGMPQPRDPAENCAQNPGQSYSYQSDGNTYHISTSLEGTQGGTGGEVVTFDGASFAAAQVQFTVTLSTSASSPTNQSIPVTAAFSLPVNDFTPSSIAGSNIGFISNFIQAARNLFTFLVTPISDGIVSILLPQNTVQSTTGQYNSQAQLSVNYDTQRPHLSLSPDPLPDHVSGAFTVTLNSTIALTSFAASSVAVSGGTVSQAQEVPPLNGENYSFVVTPNAGTTTITVEIVANTLYSAAGNGNVESNILTTQF